MDSPPPPARRAALRRALHVLALAVLVAGGVRLCWPSDTEAARASVTASVAQRLGTRPGLVELEWFEVRSTEDGFEFEARARVSASQPGDLHAERYSVHGTARSVGGDEAVVIRELSLGRVPDVPPEPRP